MKEEGPKKVNALLAKYRNILKAPQGSVVKSFIKNAERECGFLLTKEVVTYTPSTRTLSVQIAGPRKQEILFAKGRILDAMKEELGVGSAPHHII